jgi:uncharacterized protein YmfQ (DUF2313 family)
MNHADTLKLLFPAELTGVFADDIALEGKQLDDAQASADMLLAEMFPDAAHDTLADWERVCGLIPAVDDPLQKRRNAVALKLRERGGLSRAYFIALAATLGWTITIDELMPFQCGWNRCGDALYIVDVRWIWRVNVSGQSVYTFQAGIAATGERLCWWAAATDLETVFNNLKPAHTYVIFSYN